MCTAPPNSSMKRRRFSQYKDRRRLSRMQIIPAREAFELPDDWVVEIRPRRSSSKINSDTYYYEPYSGRQFRSMVSIKRYLYGNEEPIYMPRQKAPKFHQEGALKFGTTRKIVYGGKLEDLEASGRRREDVALTALQNKVSSMLPDGWIVEDVPRRKGVRSDRYFIEPETKRKFRSMSEVQRYLTTDDEYAAKFKPLKMINDPMTSQQGSYAMESPSLPPETENPESFISRPPEKVTWILSNSEPYNNWIPFVGESPISDHVKELWLENFFWGMTGKKERLVKISRGEDDSA